MPYTPPPYRQIAIDVPSAGLSIPLFATLENRPWTRAQIASYESQGKTVAGSTRVSRASHLPYYLWTGSLAGRIEDVAILDEIDRIVQESVKTQVVLSDEYDPLSVGKAAWHNREIIIDSQFVRSGVTLCYCRFNAFLSGFSYNYFGGGGYEVAINAEELI